MKKVLIANRGEIALRIMRTCRELGLQTVAVYSTADASAPYVLFADERCCLGPPPALESYLHFDRIFEAVHRSGADALHPGYGFLSENPLLPQLCEEHHITFIGPSVESMKILGGKIASKKNAIAHGVPVVPGETEPISSLEHATQVAKKIGYPILIKAVFGGGGKGMRTVYSEENLEKSLQEARSEAKSSFKNEQVFIEKWIQQPRHIEFQIFSDKHGNHIYLGERECSIQRRHQKLIEETPSVALDPELRMRMGKTAATVARSANYLGAGTVEFLLDADKNFYFLEMNTRLQVEHPVTEMVLGMDLVAEQIRVAQGLPLSRKQEDIAPRGWAIECRICAEEPETFIPSSGTIHALREPSGPFVRVDSGIRALQEISSYYDSLLSKLIVWGENREKAIQRMRRALKDYYIVGVQTNIPFNLRMLEHPRFLKGDISIHFIQEEQAYLTTPSQKHENLAHILTAALEMERQQSMIPQYPHVSRWNSPHF